MNKVLMMCILTAPLAIGCGEDSPFGTGGSGGTGTINTTWDVSNYTVVPVVGEDCGASTPTEPLTAFEIRIAGSNASLESVDLVLGGTTTTYDPTDVTVVFTDSFTDGPAAEPDCVVQLTDTFTVDLRDTSVSLDQNTTVDVTWDHGEVEDVSAVPDSCTPAVWFNIDLPCDSQATFTLTQQIE